jgi:UDP-glucose 4-epimerase
MKVLLTSLGQLGEAVITSLSGEYEFQVLCRKPQDDITDAFLGDIRSFESIEEAAEGTDAIVHTAGLWHKHIQSHAYRDFYDTNATGTFNVLEAAVKHGVAKVVLASTAGVYYEVLSAIFGGACGAESLHVDEHFPTKPYDIYASTKIMAEQLCEFYSRDKDLKTICLRFGHFPIRESTAQYASRFHRGWIVDVRDCVESVRCALRTERIHHGAYQVAAPLPYTQDDEYELVHNTGAVLQKYFSEEMQYFQSQNLELDTSPIPFYLKSALATEELGLECKYDLKTLVKELQETNSC